VNQEARFFYLDLINEHPFGKREKKRPFHQNLAL